MGYAGEKKLLYHTISGKREGDAIAVVSIAVRFLDAMKPFYLCESKIFLPASFLLFVYIYS